ncbi:unnamed protein product [Peniophora sp. CBMAI 1063]|nr:unnamed protein product [Peniophora sp. CBMAI 1063]
MPIHDAPFKPTSDTAYAMKVAYDGRLSLRNAQAAADETRSKGRELLGVRRRTSWLAASRRRATRRWTGWITETAAVNGYEVCTSCRSHDRTAVGGPGSPFCTGCETFHVSRI